MVDVEGARERANPSAPGRAVRSGGFARREPIGRRQRGIATVHRRRRGFRCLARRCGTVMAVAMRADRLLIGPVIVVRIRIDRGVGEPLRGMGGRRLGRAGGGLRGGGQDKQGQKRRKQRRHPTAPGRGQSHGAP